MSFEQGGRQLAVSITDQAKYFSGVLEKLL